MPDHQLPSNGIPGGWLEYRQRVLYQLDTLTTKVEALDHKVTEIHTDMVILKTKAGIYGGAAAVIVSAGVEMVLWLIRAN